MLGGCLSLGLVVGNVSACCVSFVLVEVGSPDLQFFGSLSPILLLDWGSLFIRYAGQESVIHVEMG